MNIKILQTSDGFYFYKNRKNLKWGDGLINLVNTNLDKLKDLTNVQSPEGKTYIEFLKPFLEIKKMPLYYEFIRSSIIDFLDYHNSYYEGNFYNIIINDPFSFLNEIHKLIDPLFYCQKKVSDILSSLVCNSNENKKLPTTEIFKKIYESNNSFFEFNIKSPFGDFEYEKVNTIFDIPSSNYKIELNEKNIVLAHNFYSICDFCIYELFNFINTKPQFIKCRYCQKITTVKKINTYFCSNNCRDNYNNSNPFYVIYRTKYKNISHKYYEANYTELSSIDLREQLKNLYNEYKIYWNTLGEAQKLKEFKEKLREIK